MSEAKPEDQQVVADGAHGDDRSDRTEKDRPQSLMHIIFSRINIDGDDFYHKWSGPMILGPLVPAIFCMFVIISGEIIVRNNTGEFCGFPLEIFIQAAVAVSYLFLLVYSWIFIGDKLVFQWDFLFKLHFTFAYPYHSLKWVMIFYIIIGFTSFIVWIVGTALLNSSFLCIATAPKLYSYTLFLVACYWLGFVIIILSLINIMYGDRIQQFIKDQLTGASQAELEERIFKKKFLEFDKDKTDRISKDDGPALLMGLGIYVPDEELPALMKSFDPDNSGFIRFEIIYDWFKKMSATEIDDDEMEGGENNNKSSKKK
jgi:hypothetical protein